MEHTLKCWPEFFDDIAAWRKSFELRRDDRAFAVGDTLRLQEWIPDRCTWSTSRAVYTGRETSRRVSFVMRHADYLAVPPGYCILGLEASHAPKALPTAEALIAAWYGTTDMVTFVNDLNLESARRVLALFGTSPASA